MVRYRRDGCGSQSNSLRSITSLWDVSSVIAACSHSGVVHLQSTSEHLAAQVAISGCGVLCFDTCSGDIGKWHLMLRIYDLRVPLASRPSLSLECNLDAMQNKSRPPSRAPASPLRHRNSSSSDDRPSPSDNEDEHSSRGAPYKTPTIPPPIFCMVLRTETVSVTPRSQMCTIRSHNDPALFFQSSPRSSAKCPQQSLDSPCPPNASTRCVMIDGPTV